MDAIKGERGSILGMGIYQIITSQSERSSVSKQWHDGRAQHGEARLVHTRSTIITDSRSQTHCCCTEEQLREGTRGEQSNYKFWTQLKL